MSKIQRNKPCSCGSNKKYKKCCGALMISTPEKINHQLAKIHQHLFTLIDKTMEHQINRLVDQHRKDFAKGLEDIQVLYRCGLVSWLITHKPIWKGNQTLFDSVYNQVKFKVHSDTRKVISEWGSIAPCIYEVITVGEFGKEFIVENILSGQRFNVKVQGDSYIEGCILVGTLVPYVNHHSFLYNVVKLFQHDKAVLVEHWKEVMSKNEGVIKHFPELLVLTLKHGIEASKIDHPVYEKVAQIYLTNMVEKEVDNGVILEGFNYWIGYCQRENPNVKKAAAYAAALDYMVHKIRFPERTNTQIKVANEYNVSPGAVSNNYRKLCNGMKELLVG